RRRPWPRPAIASSPMTGVASAGRASRRRGTTSPPFPPTSPRRTARTAGAPRCPPRPSGRRVAKAPLVGAAASYLLKTDTNPDGLDRAVFDGIKQGVLGDRKAYLTGLLSDVFFDA